MLGHILIVDDTKINRMVLSRALKKQGYDVTEAENGSQALDMLRAQGGHSFDAVLLDILMPGMDGYEVLETIKDDETLRHIPVIMISALDEMDSVVQCIEMGATDYLHKPFNSALLEARLSSSLAEKQLRDLELEYLEQVGYVVSAAEYVESGSFDPDTLNDVAARDDAIGQLARVFQRMAKEIHLREQRLKQHLQRLEQDIEEMRKAQTEPPSVFLAMDRRQALAHGQELSTRSSGSVLFADISGFSPMTSTLAAELGMQQGAEALTRHINTVYTALIAEVHRYGGSVINFSGDAITCWFSDDVEGLRASTAALNMQAAIAQIDALTTPSGRSFQVGIKVAIVQGIVRRFSVGDPQIRKMDVLAGQILDDVAVAEQHAQRGEILVSSRIADALGDSLEIREWRESHEPKRRYAVISNLSNPCAPQPWVSLPTNALTDEQCKPWILPDVYQLLDTGSRQFLAELRSAVALFVQFLGFDFEDDKVEQDLDRFICEIQYIVRSYGGSIIQLTIGDKGSYLYASFGAPITYDDDAVRAVRAALEIQMLQELFPTVTQINIGIAQGQMRTGAYGSSTRRTYGVLGDMTIRAARLMQASINSITCDESIFLATHTRIEFEQLPQIKVKGLDTPVSIFRPLFAKALTSRSVSPFVGRDEELATMLAYFSKAQADMEPVALCVCGEPGIGKTRLLNGFQERIQEADTLIFKDFLDVNSVNSFWRHLVLEVLAIPQLEHLQSQEQKVRYILDDDLAAETADSFMAYLVLQLPENAQDVAEQHTITENVQNVLVKIVEWVGKLGLPVFILDDMQALTDELLQKIFQQLEFLGRFLFVFSSHTLISSDSKDALQILELSPLSDDAIEQLVCGKLKIQNVPEAIMKLLQEASGNPLHIEEMLYFLIDEGVLVEKGDSYQLNQDDALDTVALPTTLRGIFQSKLDRLAPSQQSILKMASAIGDEFSLQIVQDLLINQVNTGSSKNHQNFLDDLKSLAKLGFLTTISDVQMRFTNLLMRDVVYNSMLFAQRRQLHRTIATWYEDHIDDLAPYYAILAAHWNNAEESVKAIEYYERAGHYAAQQNLYDEAELYFKAGLELERNSSMLSTGFYAEKSDEI